jgi:hypothetical protein
MQHDIYRPAVFHRLTAGLGERGILAALEQKLVSSSILQYVHPPAVTETYDPSCCEGLIETRYRIPNWRTDFKLLKIGVPTSVLRTTGYGPNLFALGCRDVLTAGFPCVCFTRRCARYGSSDRWRAHLWLRERHRRSRPFQSVLPIRPTAGP